LLVQFAVAVVTPPRYSPSEGFREVAFGVHHALLALGHSSVLTDSLDHHERRTIVLGSNLLPFFKIEPPRNAIFYNLEQVFESSPWITPALLDLFRRHAVWDYSQANIEQLAAQGVHGVSHVPIGYVPELTRIEPAPEDLDVLFYGSYSARREAIIDELAARGIRVGWLMDLYGAERDALPVNVLVNATRKPGPSARQHAPEDAEVRRCRTKPLNPATNDEFLIENICGPEFSVGFCQDGAENTIQPLTPLCLFLQCERLFNRFDH